MPLFFIISGFCAGYSVSSFRKTLLKSSIQLLAPYVIWTLFLCLTLNLNFLESIIIRPRYWFLLVLFVVRMVTALSQHLSKKHKNFEFVFYLIFTLVLAIAHLVFKINILCINVFYYYLIFYLVGYYLNRNYENLALVSKNNYVIFVLAVIYAGWGFVFHRGVTPEPIAFLPGFLYTIPLALVGSLLFILLFARFLDRELKLLNFFGVHSLGIYVVSGMICWNLVVYLPQLVVIASQNMLLVYLLFIAICVISGAFVKSLSLINWARPLIGLKYIRREK